MIEIAAAFYTVERALSWVFVAFALGITAGLLGQAWWRARKWRAHVKVKPGRASFPMTDTMKSVWFKRFVDAAKPGVFADMFEPIPQRWWERLLRRPVKYRPKPGLPGETVRIDLGPPPFEEKS